MVLINHEICITNLCFVQITSESYKDVDTDRNPILLHNVNFSASIWRMLRQGGVGSESRVLNSQTFSPSRGNPCGNKMADPHSQTSLCFSHLVVVDHKRFFQSNLIKRVTCSFRKTQQIPSSLILKLQLKSFELHQPSLLHIRCSRLYVKYILLSSRFKYVMLSWGLNF